MHAEYEVSACIISKVMANIKVGHKQRDQQTNRRVQNNMPLPFSGIQIKFSFLLDLLRSLAQKSSSVLYYHNNCVFSICFNIAFNVDYPNLVKLRLLVKHFFSFKWQKVIKILLPVATYEQQLLGI